MQIQVTDELVHQVARLSRLALSPREQTELKVHLEKILAFVESFTQLDTSDVDPTHFSVDTFNVYRSDEVKDSLPVAAVLANAPSSRAPYFRVPRIVDSDDQAGA